MPNTARKVNSKGAVAARCQRCLLQNEADVSRAGGPGRRLRLEFLVSGSEMRTRTKQLDVWESSLRDLLPVANRAGESVLGGQMFRRSYDIAAYRKEPTVHKARRTKSATSNCLSEHC